jgi:hypothetical protein
VWVRRRCGLRLPLRGQVGERGMMSSLFLVLICQPKSLNSSVLPGA